VLPNGLPNEPREAGLELKQLGLPWGPGLCHRQLPAKSGIVDAGGGDRWPAWCWVSAPGDPGQVSYGFGAQGSQHARWASRSKTQCPAVGQSLGEITHRTARPSVPGL